MKSIYKKLLSILFICVVGITVYSNAFFCSFHFDDASFIVQNFAIRNIYNLQNIWHYFHGRFFVFLSLALNYHFNGLNVFGYHLFNLVIHLISATLVWWLTLLTLSTPAFEDNSAKSKQLGLLREEKIAQHANVIALFVGLIFVSHPVQTEAVTYIWQRAASMAAMFYLASLCLYVKSRLLQDSVIARSEATKQSFKEIATSPAAPRNDTGRFFYVAALIMAIVAMFTKENAVTLPLMILFYEYTFLKGERGIDWKFISPFLLTLFIVPITFLFLNKQIFQGMHGELRMSGGVAITPMQYFLTEIRAMFTYIRLVFCPINQTLDYDYPIFKSIFEWPVLISLLFLFGIFYGAKCLFSKYRLISFSIVWFFLTLIIPESSFWVMGDVIFEHRLYLPMVGYSIFLVSSVYYLLGKKSIKMMIVVLSMVITCNAILTYQRNKVWRDDFTLWNDAVLKSPNKARPYINRGRFFDDQGNLPQALSNYTKAIEIDPYNPVYYFNRGVDYDREGQINQALIEYSKALVISYNFYPSLNNIGEIYVKIGKLDLAIKEYSKAIQVAPSFAPPYLNRAHLYYKMKENDKAWADVQRLEELGYSAEPGFIRALKKASGKSS